MTPGEQLIGSISLKDSFYDEHERRSYLLMMEVAKSIIDDPSLVKRGRRFLERFVRDDPNQKHAYIAWSTLLGRPSEEIARSLLSDDERGASLRDTAPVFVVIPPTRKRHIWSRVL